MADPTDPDSKKPYPVGDYTVGYKRPPIEHQFKPNYLRDGPQNPKSRRKENALDIAGIFDKPLRVKRGGKTIAMDPYEAELTSLGKRALIGPTFRATRYRRRYGVICHYCLRCSVMIAARTASTGDLTGP